MAWGSALRSTSLVRPSSGKARFRHQGFGHVRGPGFRVWGLGFRVLGSGFSVQGLGLGFSVLGLEFKV